MVSSLYLLLKGSVTVFIHSTLADEEDAEKLAEWASRATWRNDQGQLDRTKFGASVDTMGKIPNNT